MGSGYFPLRKDEENGNKLIKAAGLIDEVLEDVREDVYGGADGQFDNSASDGGSMALLRLAYQICIDEVEQ